MTDAPEDPLKATFAKLDEKALMLLDNAIQPTMDGSAEARPTPALEEQVRVFEAVTRYFASRLKGASDGAEKPKGSEFGKLRDKLHSGSSRSRSRGATKPAAAGSNGASFDAVTEDR